MNMNEPKRKKLCFAILEILKQHTDPAHRLNQNDILALLEREYDIIADRKSIKRNITTLLEMGYPIEFTETLRRYPNKQGELEDSYIFTDFYLEREFNDAELRLLIDSLLFSKLSAVSTADGQIGRVVQPLLQVPGAVYFHTAGQYAQK